MISTILIRFSLMAGSPHGALLAVMRMLFGIGTLLIYNYHLDITGVHSGHGSNASKDDAILAATAA